MDRAEALENLRSEIKQIVDNYEDSLSRTRGPEWKIADNRECVDPLPKIYLKYAIMIYRDALRYVDYLISIGNPK